MEKIELKQKQDQLCPQCRFGEHESCTRRIGPFECCCHGQPSRTIYSKDPPHKEKTEPEPVKSSAGLEVSTR